MTFSCYQGDASHHHELPDQTCEPIDRLSAVAEQQGWRRALEEVLGLDADQARYVIDPARYRFVDHLPKGTESTILEVGSNLGQITCALAQKAGFVHGIEIAPESARFAAIRARQEGYSNVSIVAGGKDCRLPHEDAAFDGVVINLVLEWCAESDIASDHREMQRRMLQESARVLKPNGWLFLATKNRHGIGYLTGGADEHTFGWRFGQALPRRLLKWLMRLRGKTRTKGLIHSYSELCRLLTEAGFSQLEPFWAVPEFRYPTELIRADASSIKQARRRPGFVQGPNRRTRILMPLVPASLVKYVTPGLIFLARKAKSTEVQRSLTSGSH
jgi:SAM-dependent methyltransferase